MGAVLAKAVAGAGPQVPAWSKWCYTEKEGNHLQEWPSWASLEGSATCSETCRGFCEGHTGS
jgi:hypothetical protein